MPFNDGYSPTLSYNPASVTKICPLASAIEYSRDKPFVSGQGIVFSCFHTVDASLLPPCKGVVIVLCHRDWNTHERKMQWFQVMYIIEARKDLSKIHESHSPGRWVHLAGQLSGWDHISGLPTVQVYIALMIPAGHPNNADSQDDTSTVQGGSNNIAFV